MAAVSSIITIIFRRITKFKATNTNSFISFYVYKMYDKLFSLILNQSWITGISCIYQSKINSQTTVRNKSSRKTVYKCKLIPFHHRKFCFKEPFLMCL